MINENSNSDNKFVLFKLLNELTLIAEKGNQPLFIELKESIDKLRREFFVKKAYKNIHAEFYKIFANQTGNSKIALVFGAGISMGNPFYMCNWSGLLKNAVTGHFLAPYNKSNAYTDMDKFLESYGDFLGKFDLYELAQYIENSIRERHATDKYYGSEEIEYRVNSDIYEIVKRSIYLDKNIDGTNKKITSFSEFETQLKKSLLYRLCKYVDEKNIERILTYNYDNAFEYTYDKYNDDNSNIEKSLFPIFIDNQLPSADESRNCVCCYHVHGYVPYFSDKYRKRVEQYLENQEARRLILSEYSYDDMAHSSYKWRNTLQIDTFLKYNCLFFGFSATDKNFKRIVKLMGWRNEGTVFDEEHEAKHYIFMTIDDYIRNIFGDLAPIVFYDKEDCKSAKERKAASEKRDEAQRKLQNDFAENPNDLLKKLIVQCRLMYYTLRSRRKYLKGLNIYPLWCTTYDAVDCFDYMLSSD